MKPYRKLYRSRTDKMLGGVAGGLADYFSIDSSLVRFLFILAVIAWGTGFWLYVVLWIVLPLSPLPYFNQGQPDPANANTGYNDFEKSPEEWESGSDNLFESMQNAKMRRRENGNLIAGVVLISFGAMFLISDYIPSIDFSDLWPFLLIVAGGLLLRNYYQINKNQKS